MVAAPFHGDSRIVKVRLEDEDDVLEAILNFDDYIAMQAVRPIALASTVDWLLAEPTFKDRVDPNAIAGFGASLGAQSLILMAGARLTHSIGLSSKPVMSDARLKAIAGYVPYFGQTFFPSFGEDQGGIEDMLPVPLLSIAGTADTTAPTAAVEDGMRRIPQSRTYVDARRRRARLRRAVGRRHLHLVARLPRRARERRPRGARDAPAHAKRAGRRRRPPASSTTWRRR